MFSIYAEWRLTNCRSTVRQHRDANMEGELPEYCWYTRSPTERMDKNGTHKDARCTRYNMLYPLLFEYYSSIHRKKKEHVSGAMKHIWKGWVEMQTYRPIAGEKHWSTCFMYPTKSRKGQVRLWASKMCQLQRKYTTGRGLYIFVYIPTAVQNTNSCRHINQVQTSRNIWSHKGALPIDQTKWTSRSDQWEPNARAQGSVGQQGLSANFTRIQHRGRNGERVHHGTLTTNP